MSNDDLKALDETRSESEYRGNSYVLMDGDTAHDWVEIGCWTIVLVLGIMIVIGFIVDHWKG